MSALDDLLSSFVKAIVGQVKAEQETARIRALCGGLCDEADELGRDVWVAKLRQAIEREQS
jgi:hypothetical protein